MKQVDVVLLIKRCTRTMALVFQSPGIVQGSLPTASHLMFIATFLCRCYCHHHYTDEETKAWVGAELAWGHVARGGQRWVWNASRLGGAYTSNHFFLCFKSYSIPRFPAECIHENVQASFPRPSELRVDWQFMLNRILNQYSSHFHLEICASGIVQGAQQWQVWIPV